MDNDMTAVNYNLLVACRIATLRDRLRKDLAGCGYRVLCAPRTARGAMAMRRNVRPGVVLTDAPREWLPTCPRAGERGPDGHLPPVIAVAAKGQRIPEGSRGRILRVPCPKRELVLAVERAAGRGSDGADRTNPDDTARASEAKYRGLVEATGTGYVIIDGKGRVRDANAEYLRLTGRRTMAEIMGRPVTDWTAPHDRARNGREVVKCMRRGSVRMLEIDYQRPDGSVVPVEINATVVALESEPLIVTLCRDITQRKRTEAVTRESEEKFNKAFRKSPIVMLITGLADGKVIDVNDEFTRLFRVTRDQVVGKDTCQLRLWTDRAQRAAKLRAARQRGSMRNMPLEMRTWDGRRLSLLLSSETIAIGGEACLLTSAFDVTEAKQVERQLRESECRYRLLAENSNEVVWTAGLDAKFTYVSPSIRQLQGYTAEEAMRIGMPGLVAPESRALLRGLQRELKARLRGGRLPRRAARTAVLACRHKNGRRLWCEITVMLQRDRAGRPTGLLGITRDVTTRRQAEDALRESETRLRTLVQKQGEGIGIVDTKERFIFANPAAERIFGTNPGRLAGRTLRRFTDRAGYDEIVRQSALRRLGIGGSYELEIRKQNGRRRRILVTATPQRDASGRHSGTFGIFRDITELKRTEQALRESEQRFRSFIEQSAEGIVILDERGRVGEWNRAQERIYGVPREQALGRAFWDLQHRLTPPAKRTPGQRGRFRALVTEALRTGRSPIFEAPVIVDVEGRNGEIRHTQQRAFPIRTDRGFRIGTAVLDVTEQKRLEQEIIEISDRVQRDIGNDLHDGLGQLLTVIGLRLKALEQGPAGPGGLKEISRLVKQAMTQSAALSRGLSPVSLEAGGLVPALRELAANAAAASGIRCRADLDEAAAIGGIAAATHCYRIAQEAIGNAIKHARASRIDVRLHRDGAAAVLEVSDDGKGIAMRLPARGGMGYHIMHYRARMIGADLEIRPSPSGGTTVSCRFLPGSRPAPPGRR